MSDTQPAPAPVRGMQRIPLPLDTYSHSSLPLSAKRLLNFYPEQEPSDARSAAALIPTPGLMSFQSVGSGPIKAINADLPGIIYLVSGTRAYRIRIPIGGPVVDDLGDVGVPDTGVIPDDRIMITIAVSDVAAVLCVPPRAYTCGHGAADALNQIGGTFPGASSVAYLNGYFGFTAYENTAQWFVSQLMDPADFDALDFAYADAQPNVVNRIIAHRGEFWLIGGTAHEVWYDSGDADFPFRPRPGGVVPFGTQSPRSVAQADGSVWWVGFDNIVYRSVGYQAKRVSNHAIETVISERGSAVVTSALTYTQVGHTFYCVTVANRTLCYDVPTDAWHERASSADGTGPWRPSCAPLIGGYFALGDSLSGRLLTPVMYNPFEVGVQVLRQATLPPLWAGTRRAFCARLEVEMEVGSATDPAVQLEWSDDGGWSYNGGPRQLNAGLPHQTRKRVYTTRLGSFRQRVFRISTWGFNPIFAVDADIIAGAS